MTITKNQQATEMVDRVIREYVDGLHGYFTIHVSDTFLVAYLRDQVINGWNESIQKERPISPAQNAYNCSVKMFEYYLEGCCEIKRNGHHVAQNFAAAFEEIEIERIKLIR